MVERIWKGVTNGGEDMERGDEWRRGYGKGAERKGELGGIEERNEECQHVKRVNR